MKANRILSGAVISATLFATSAMATEWTLIVAPARHSVLQVMFDVLRHRPTVLVSYQSDATEAQPALHVWNGEEWAPLSMRDLAEVRFVQVVPARVILVGDDTTLPPALAEATAWCARTAVAEKLDTPSLVNDFGRLFNFSPPEWRWFSARYNLTLKDRSADARGASWYDRQENAPPPPDIPLFRRHRTVPAGPTPVAPPLTPAVVPVPEEALVVGDLPGPTPAAFSPPAVAAPAPTEDPVPIDPPTAPPPAPAGIK